MAIYYDNLDFRRDNFEVLPRHEWRIFGRAVARKPTKFFRFCQPNCESFQIDFDKKPLCMYGCTQFVFERHMIDVGEYLVNLLFAVNTLDQHEGISIWIGEDYLKKLIGDSLFNKMMLEYKELLETQTKSLDDYITEEDDDAKE